MPDSGEIMSKKLNNAVGPQLRGEESPTRFGFKTRFAWVLLSFVFGLWLSTQIFAYVCGYDVALGWNIKQLYLPFAILKWWHDWYAGQAAFYAAGSSGVFVTALCLTIMTVAMIVANRDSAGNAYLHGSARWAEEKDIRAAGLLNNKGVIVGAWQMPARGLFGKPETVYLRHNGPEHILCYAPTRSGKGVGLVLPTLLTWPHSTVITDLKGELWAMTAGWRKSWAGRRGDSEAGNIVLRFEPAAAGRRVMGKDGQYMKDRDGKFVEEPVCACWNPLDEIRMGEYDPDDDPAMELEKRQIKPSSDKYETGDVQNLATLIVDPDGKGLTDHWQKTSQALIVGCILYLLYERRKAMEIAGTLVRREAKSAGKALDSKEVREAVKRAGYDAAMKNKATMAALDKLLASPPVNEETQMADVKLLWQKMVHDYPDSTVSRSAQDMLDRPEQEGGSVLSTAKSYLALYRDPIVAKNTSASQFAIQDLMNSERPVSLYIITQPTDKNRLKPLVRVMINMIVRLQAKDMEYVTTGEGTRAKGNYKFRQLLMIDEFPSLGKLDIMQESLAFIAGYGMKAYLITQDLSQLQDPHNGYGHDEAISSNCHVQNAYPPNRPETAKHLSQATGQTTIMDTTYSVSGKRIGFLSQVSKQMRETSRPLLTEDECSRMPGPVKNAEGMITKAGDMLIFVSGYPAIYGRQPLYFKDKKLSARSSMPAPVQSDVCRPEVKTEWDYAV
jgi:type IV secretion system protein VirD4